MIEQHFDIPFIADLALREKQIQQNYRPVIAVHKWFARRPGTLFRGLLLAEFSSEPLREAFYSSNSLPDIRVLDPFMGGGTTLIEANRMGCKVTGFDINPMAYWIVREELETLDLRTYSDAVSQLRRSLENEIGRLFLTRCVYCDSRDAWVKYFLWTKTVQCRECAAKIDLFPNYLVARAVRHPRNVFVCWRCGDLYEVESDKQKGHCPTCHSEASQEFTARRGHVRCQSCKSMNTFPDANGGPPEHRMFALEYNCGRCRRSHDGRFFKRPDSADLGRFDDAKSRLGQMTPRFVPDDCIPIGDETARLHRWGYERYREMFNARQLLGLEISCRFIAEVNDRKVRRALATNLSDLLRYQNMLCRYDPMALKSLDIFSVHGFPVGQIQCESNLLGIPGLGRQTTIGSGGWLNISDKFAKAKAFCSLPFEFRHTDRRKRQVLIRGEWIGEGGNGQLEGRSIDLSCDDATRAALGESEYDAVLTDPPYFGNVQYAELMDFCYVWLRRLIGDAEPCFSTESTRHPNELTGNVSLGRTIEDFAEGLSRAFQNAASALKAGSPFVFTYHHNDLESYYPVAIAILDSGLVCSASLPCPAEMGASIHINGTASSILDTVFVCRTSGRFPRRWLAPTASALADLIISEINLLREAGLEPSQGDIRCMIFGHLTRLAIWDLRRDWSKSPSAPQRMTSVRHWIEQFGGWKAVRNELGDAFGKAQPRQKWEFRDSDNGCENLDEISF